MAPLLAFFFSVGSSQAQTFQVLHVFQGQPDGESPQGRVEGGREIFGEPVSRGKLVSNLLERSIAIASQRGLSTLIRTLHLAAWAPRLEIHVARSSNAKA